MALLIETNEKGSEDEMSERMTRARLDEIKARADAATVGPWVRRLDAHDQVNIYANDGEFTEVDWVAMLPHQCVTRIEEMRQNDAAFIVGAREDVPAMLAEIERAWGEAAALNTTLTNVWNALATALVEVDRDPSKDAEEMAKQAADVIVGTLTGRAESGYRGACEACNIEAKIGTEEVPHPIDARIHTCPPVVPPSTLTDARLACSRCGRGPVTTTHRDGALAGPLVCLDCYDTTPPPEMATTTGDGEDADTLLTPDEMRLACHVGRRYWLISNALTFLGWVCGMAPRYSFDRVITATTAEVDAHNASLVQTQERCILPACKVCRGAK